MLRLIGIPFICLAVFGLVGGHWAVLQTVAWAGMLKEYSKNASLGEAAEKTFSGESPCALCHKVEEGQKKEDQSLPFLKADKKSEVFLPLQHALAGPVSGKDFSHPRPESRTALSRSEEPPSPVPWLS